MANKKKDVYRPKPMTEGKKVFPFFPNTYKKLR